MARRKGTQKGAQQHAEGAHGKRTHARFIEQLHETEPRPASGAPREVDGHHRLHQDRQQHDEADKNSEKVRALRQVERGDRNENVIGHARVPPHEGDTG